MPVNREVARDLNPLAPMGGEIIELLRRGREREARKHRIGIGVLNFQKADAFR